MKTNKMLAIGVCMGWVKGIFRPNPPQWVKKNPTQPTPSQGYNPTQSNSHELGWVGLNPWVGQFFFYSFFYYYYYYLEQGKSISHLPPELINKIFINQYFNLVINKTYPTELIKKKTKYMNFYPNSVINKYEWNGSVRVGGGRER